MVADDYALKPTRISLIESGHNDTYAVQTGRARFAFRVYGQDKSWIREVSDLRFELDLLSHLRAQRAPVSFPIERRSGDTLGTWSSSTGERHYALFIWCPGRTIDTKDLTLQEAARLGAALASIHVGADTFVTPYSRYVLDERTLLERSLRRMRPALDRASPGDARFIENCAVQVGDRLGAFEAGPAGWGVIHGDPQALNCHFTGDGSVNFFDFDHCGFGWRAYDIAYCLRHTNAAGDRRGEEIRSAVIAGYDSVRPLSQAEYQMLPTLGQAAWIREGTAAGQGL
ncbi:MAG: phosphotransferase, partial [Microlunatus sp.]|nr:phosphotransferase [Microlunatus sp.]